MITWTPYPRQQTYAAEYAQVQGFVLTAGHDGSWAVWKSGNLEKHREALISGERIECSGTDPCRSSAELWPLPNPARNLIEAKHAAESAFNEMIQATA